MLERGVLEVIFAESDEKVEVEIVPRDVKNNALKFLGFKHVFFISGVRRCGKTFLVFDLMKELVKKGVPLNNILYINFEDERLAFLEPKDLSTIYQAFLELRDPVGKVYFFLDEIQNVKLWDKWISRMYEKNIKFIVTGSNASLLSSEFSTALTGRNVTLELLPFSFKEFVKTRNKELLNKSFFTEEEEAKIKRLLNQYLQFGGFPEVVLNKKREILANYFNDILFRDIIKRYNIKYKEAIEKMALYLISNSASISSYSQLKKMLGLKSLNTAKNYANYLEKAYLIFKIPFFSYSLKQQIYNPFKVYCADLGLISEVAFKFSENKGKKYENTVFLELKRKRKNIYYWKDKKGREVDFLIKEKNKIIEAIQVCVDPSNEKTIKREISSLLEALKQFNLKKGTIITQDIQKTEIIKNKKIQYMPLWKWLIQPIP